jgi:hypothetical protein
MNMEGIVRPFTEHPVTPTPFTKPGAGSNEAVRLAIGFKGAIKTLSYSFSCTVTTKMGQVHKEKPATNSAAVRNELSKAAGG